MQGCKFKFQMRRAVCEYHNSLPFSLHVNLALDPKLTHSLNSLSGYVNMSSMEHALDNCPFFDD